MISDQRVWIRPFVGIVVVTIVVGCLDVSGVSVPASIGAASQSRECASCYSSPDSPGPGCADEVAACYADERCKKAFVCSVEQGCFQGAKEQLITCGSECSRRAGFVSMQEHAYQLALDVYACLLGPCKDACFGRRSTDAGVADASVAADADVVREGGTPEAARICPPPGTPNNEIGIGGYCKTSGDCSGAAGLRFCVADFGGDNFCTGLCTVDADCGSGAVYCAHSAQGSGCVPRACGDPSEGGTEQ